MNRTFRSLGVAVCGAAVVAGAIASPLAYAGEIKKEFPEDLKDRNHIARSFGKTVAAAVKAGAGCHAARNAGKVDQAVDCNDLSPSEGDVSGAFAKARAKLEQMVAKLDADSYPGTAALETYTTCPEPCATETGVTIPPASYTELGECLACLAGDLAGRRSADMLGSPAGPLGPVEHRCSAAIAKGYAKRIATIVKGRQKCQVGQDKLENFALQPCDTSDPKGAIAKATMKAEAAVDAACGTADLSAVGSCSAMSVVDLKACLLAADDGAGTEAFGTSYGRDP